MKSIDIYLQSLYLGNKNNYIEDLIEEIREHLIESTNNFISQGYGIEEAQNKAIADFDNGNCTLKDLYIELSKDIELLNNNNKILIKRTNILCKIFKYISIIGILILLSLTVLYKSDLIYSTQYFEWDTVKISFNEKIKYIASTHNVNDVESYREDLDFILRDEEFNLINGVRIYNNEKSSYSDNKLDALYTYGTSLSDGDTYSYSSNLIGFDGGHWYYRIDINENYLSHISKVINNIFIYITPISIIIYLYFKFTLKNLSSL